MFLISDHFYNIKFAVHSILVEFLQTQASIHNTRVVLVSYISLVSWWLYTKYSSVICIFISMRLLLFWWHCGVHCFYSNSNDVCGFMSMDIYKGNGTHVYRLITGQYQLWKRNIWTYRPYTLYGTTTKNRTNHVIGMIG